MVLHPQAKFLLDQMAEADETPMHLQTPQEAREATDFSPLAGEPEEVAKVEDRTIPGPEGDIPVRVYTPEGEGPFPALVFYHGGGWVIGDLESVDVPCRMIANRSECVVVSVDYRLAPEHKFPAAVDDAYAALRWVASYGKEINVDPSHVAVGGDSAGGNLAAVTSLMARDRQEFSVSYQMLIYPVTNYSFETESYKENADDYLLTKDSMQYFWNHYLLKDRDGSSAYASPLLVEDLSDLPPAFVVTAGYDPLRDEGEAYAERLRTAGVDVEYHKYDGMIHGFFWMPGVLDDGRDCIERASAALKQAFE
ncbi:alpha/beta hydrolase [Salimicrobium halophilum]|uniref:Acetyl esterase n=1 Tax=Salimicrobium halophilum TaxID=86666 RepID=A0A1G8RIY2_9BACI|nr:alpha/beta hydrolase [Salimicrobium halophilum]SDJ16889.1 acetyl esterase [Salimicrobium halophilum]